jgi:VIT1/CCC1 family predicted Fe2+/Mn2+ transporter
MNNEGEQKNEPVLDPIDRASETIFGVLMATTFTGSLSVATAGSQDIRTMLFAALGCNIAWGFTDAVMYLIGAATERQRNITLLLQLQTNKDPQAGQRLIADTLPDRLAAGASSVALEAIRKQLLTIKAPSSMLGKQDYAAALGVFVLVILSTFPVVIPFLFFSETATALRVSNLLAIITIFASGLVLGRYAGGKTWHYGLVMTAIGLVLVGIIIALGG